ncbi:hypothetical protein [Salmonella enterica]|uniref:Phage protein n=1 Tax=Salmonella potsdam TaxID=597 RepID=A0A702C165_SALPO|nr:hypothetical protein [Salmonella enterica subsp. enterica]EDY0609097.1 hypothetical protein [Salmonella enterica subsp. enterica serovar Thompson]MDJ6799515.1 hypothetical protein [Salmonella enterica]HAC6705106.1 hypothetical protein [Salmonella enterica subsp. enterica serovar Potsdam]MDK0482191.1 hypothetical protein [Salmonella enterica]
MKLTWFHHHDLTNEEANQLITAYQSRNVKTQRTLSADPRLWNVAALLPEYAKEPRVDKRFQQRIWQ